MIRMTLHVMRQFILTMAQNRVNAHAREAEDEHEWASREWELRQRRPQVDAETMAARAAGDVDRAILFYGQDAGLIDTIEPAGEIVARMAREACDVIAAQTSGLRPESAAGQRGV